MVPHRNVWSIWFQDDEGNPHIIAITKDWNCLSDLEIILLLDKSEEMEEVNRLYMVPDRYLEDGEYCEQDEDQRLYSVIKLTGRLSYN